jgi:hypothetical protein
VRLFPSLSSICHLLKHELYWMYHICLSLITSCPKVFPEISEWPNLRHILMVEILRIVLEWGSCR